MFQDAAGKTFTPRQALDEFAPASRAPIYGCYDTYLGHGIVGGAMVTFEEIVTSEDSQLDDRSDDFWTWADLDL